VPLRAPAIDIHWIAAWQQNGLTVAGGNGWGNGINQFDNPYGLYVQRVAKWLPVEICEEVGLISCMTQEM
jgi:hypothetical protein